MIRLISLGDLPSLEDGGAAAGHIKLGDAQVGGVDAHEYSLSISLIRGALLDVHYIFLSVTSHHLEVDVLKVVAKLTTNHLHLVTLLDGHRLDRVHLLKISGKRRSHALTAVHGGSAEVSLSLLSSRGGSVGVKLSHLHTPRK